MWMYPKSFDNKYTKTPGGNCYIIDTHTHIFMKKLISITIQLFYGWIVFEIDNLVWFTWLGEIIEISMLLNINYSCHHFPISQILNSFPHNWILLKGTLCVCWHIPIQSNSVVFPRILSLHGSLGLVNLRHAQVFEKYHMPTTKPFLDTWPWLGQPGIHNGDWQRLTIFSTKLVLSWWRRSMWQTHQVWLRKTCLGIESVQKLTFSALPICFCSVSCLHE